MSSELKDVLLIGLGAIGGVYAYVLQNSGLARVSVVARSNYASVRANGLYIKSQRYGEHPSWRPFRVLSTVEDAADRSYSHVAVTTKVVIEMQRTSELLDPLLTRSYTEKFGQPTYVLMQNGINIEVDLLNALLALQQQPKIIGTSLWIATKMLGDNVVEHSSFDEISIGVYRQKPNVLANSPEELATLNEFRDMLTAGGSDVIIVPEIHRIKYWKNALNCWINPITALTRISSQGIFRKPEDLRPTAHGLLNGVCERTPSQIATASIPASFPMVAEYTIPWIYDTLKEVADLGQILFPSSPEFPEVPGIDPNLPSDMLQRFSAIGAKPGGSEKPSMLVDVEMGRPTEIEVVLGEMVRAGRRVGAPIPRLESIYALMMIVQAQLLYNKKIRTSDAKAEVDILPES